MDRELNQVNQACCEFTGRQEEGKVVLEDVVGLLDSVNQKVSSLKTKVSQGVAEWLRKRPFSSCM